MGQGKIELYHWHVLTSLASAGKWTLGAELGVRWGQTSKFLLEHCPALHMVGVDLMEAVLQADQPTNTDQDKYPRWDWKRYEAEVQKIEAAFPERFTMLRMDTGAAAEQYADGTFDFVFIDADHSYEGVLRDIKNWGPKVRAGGMITGHDINLDGVRRAVAESFPEGWSTQGWTWNNIWWAPSE